MGTLDPNPQPYHLSIYVFGLITTASILNFWNFEFYYLKLITWLLFDNLFIFKKVSKTKLTPKKWKLQNIYIYIFLILATKRSVQILIGHAKVKV